MSEKAERHQDAAERRLEELIKEANLEIRRKGKDRYGRTLAQVIADGDDVAEQMIAEGLARPCKRAGCRRPWCKEDRRK